MTCIHCGTENHDGRRYCTSCMRDVSSPDDTPVDTSPWISMDDIQPPTSKLALGSLALGLLSIFPPAAIAAVTLGHASLLTIRHNEGRVRGNDVAKLGLICGYVGLALFSVVLFAASRFLKIPVASLMVPQRAQAATLPKEASSVPKPIHSPALDEPVAADALLKVFVAETLHYHSNPAIGYACSLNQLIGSGLTDELIFQAAEHGYRLQIDSCTTSASGKTTTFRALAVPTAGIDARSYCTDLTGIVRVPSGSDLANCTTTGIPLK
jgi:hypothetical protein